MQTEFWAITQLGISAGLCSPVSPRQLNGNTTETRSGREETSRGNLQSLWDCKAITVPGKPASCVKKHFHSLGHLLMDCGKKSDFNREMKTSKPLYKATFSPACGLNAECSQTCYIPATLDYRLAELFLKSNYSSRGHTHLERLPEETTSPAQLKLLFKSIIVFIYCL